LRFAKRLCPNRASTTRRDVKAAQSSDFDDARKLKRLERLTNGARARKEKLTNRIQQKRGKRERRARNVKARRSSGGRKGANQASLARNAQGLSPRDKTARAFATNARRSLKTYV